MQCYEFEVMRRYMSHKLTEMGLAGRYDPLEICDVLIEHEVTTIDRVADVVSLARNLQLGIKVAA